MKYIYGLLLVMMLVVASRATAQITNFVANGSGTSFTMVSGDTLHWAYDISPAGSAAIGEIWYDVNQNGTIDPLIDKVRFVFSQVDGDTLGNGGPPDMDRLVNGHIDFHQRVGLAPGKYIFKLYLNADVHYITGTITALSSPAHTISGTITPPAGKSAQYVFIQANRGGQYEPNFWDAVTDASGNYTINMDSDTAGNPWRIRPADQYDPFPPSFSTPSEIDLTISAPSYAGNDFTFTKASAQVAGHIRDDAGNPLLDVGAIAIRHDGNIYRYARAGLNGFYQIGFASGDLDGQSWLIETQTNDAGGQTMTRLMGIRTIPVINVSDSLPVELVVYSVNSSIQGTATVNGFPPGGPMQIMAANNDTAVAATFVDGTTGNFSIPVSNKIYNYNIFVVNLPTNWNAPTVVAHPGESGINYDITITSVRQREPGVPDAFLLKQNYPNPFNPVTKIDYNIANTSQVQLIVYDVVGREVSRLVDQQQQPGKYTATFDGSKLSSGIYFYHLRAGTYSKTMKLVLMK